MKEAYFRAASCTLQGLRRQITSTLSVCILSPPNCAEGHNFSPPYAQGKNAYQGSSLPS